VYSQSLPLIARETDLVLRVVNHGWVPGALVVGVGDGRSLPLTTSWTILALGVGDPGWLPFTVLFLIPVLGLLSLCITIKPIFVTSIFAARHPNVLLVALLVA